MNGQTFLNTSSSLGVAGALGPTYAAFFKNLIRTSGITLKSNRTFSSLTTDKRERQSVYR